MQLAHVPWVDPVFLLAQSCTPLVANCLFSIDQISVSLSLYINQFLSLSLHILYWFLDTCNHFSSGWISNLPGAHPKDTSTAWTGSHAAAENGGGI